MLIEKKCIAKSKWLDIDERKQLRLEVYDVFKRLIRTIKKSCPKLTSDMQKLTLKKKNISNVSDDEMGKVLGGYDAEQFGLRLLCMTDFNTGGCSPSESCNTIVCVPLTDLLTPITLC